MAGRDGEHSNLQQLQAAAVNLLRKERPQSAPLPFYLNPLIDWFEQRHIKLMHENGFPDARLAFNPVFIRLPADGCRLTELAARAGMTKQAMAELVDELVRKDFLVRFPDPSDGRAKIIVRSKKGLDAHRATMRAFVQIETELKALLGSEALTELRSQLAKAQMAIAQPDG